MSDLKVGRIEQLTHTPGPWRIGEASGHPYQIVSDARAITVWGSIAKPTQPESHANARLLASAPRLLAALKAVTDRMDRAGGDNSGMPECPWCRWQDGDGHASDCELVKARAAIDEAEGRA